MVGYGEPAQERRVPSLPGIRQLSHTHSHHHEPIAHTHEHYPDAHHQHGDESERESCLFIIFCLCVAGNPISHRSTESAWSSFSRHEPVTIL